MSISSLGCLGGGCIFPISLCYHPVLQERPNWHMCRDMSVQIFLQLQSSRFGGQLRIGAFEREDVRCLCYMLSSLSQYSSDGKHISFSMLYYVDSLLQEPQLIRWEDVFLRQFCHALDHCHSVLSGTRFFPFTSELYTLFFERVHATQPVVPHFPARPMFDVCMHMWGKLIPKRGQSEFLITLVGREVFDLLSSEDDNVLDIVEYPYVGIDWRGCPNI
jgi:hypothetical protein